MTGQYSHHDNRLLIGASVLITYLYASADPAHRANHLRQSSARKASTPSSVPEKSTARDRRRDSARLPRRDFPRTRAAGVHQGRETKERPRSTSRLESSASRRRSLAQVHLAPDGER